VEMCNSWRRYRSQRSSAHVTAKLRYGAGVLDRETVACFFALQDIRLWPRNIQKPDVYRLSSVDPAQSASL
jgi:hypothetical protein